MNEYNAILPSWEYVYCCWSGVIKALFQVHEIWFNFEPCHPNTVTNTGLNLLKDFTLVAMSDFFYPAPYYHIVPYYNLHIFQGQIQRQSPIFRLRKFLEQKFKVRWFIDMQKWLSFLQALLAFMNFFNMFMLAKTAFSRLHWKINFDGTEQLLGRYLLQCKHLKR